MCTVLSSGAYLLAFASRFTNTLRESRSVALDVRQVFRYVELDVLTTLFQ